jgi:hypothetical protein
MALTASGSRAAEVAIMEVAIGPGSGLGQFKVEVVRSPAGEASALVEFDAQALLRRRTELQNAVLASAVSARRLILGIERPMHDAGRMLFAALLGAPQVAERYRSSTALAAERQWPLRIVLRIETPELAGLPWEAMFDQSTGAYLCTQQQLVRHVPVASVPLPLAVEPPLRILGVISDPRGEVRLDVEREREILERALAGLVDQHLAEITWAPSATWAGLQEMLLAGPWHVLHYIGHGDFDADRDEGVLALTGEDGRADRVQAHRFTELLRQARPMPRLVVLNSCSGAVTGTGDLYSGTAAALVRSGVSAVTAMQYTISDTAAAKFARGFYTAIARGRGVDDAVSSGRVAILGVSPDNLEWITPVLYLRGDETRLFTIDPKPPAQPQPSPPASPPARDEGPAREESAVRQESPVRALPGYERRYAGQPIVTMLGEPVSGKTTFLAALNMTPPFYPFVSLWNVLGGDDQTRQILNDLASGLHNRRFPHATAAIHDYHCLLMTEMPTMTRRLMRARKRTSEPVRLGLHITDAPGGLLEERSWGNPAAEEFIDLVAQSHGLIYLFDPVTAAERGGAHANLFNLLTRVAGRMAAERSFAEGKLPHYVAVCISKYDDPRVFPAETNSPINPNHVPLPADARHFFLEAGRHSSGSDAELIAGTIERFFRPERVQYFVTSAIGLYANPMSGQCDPGDFQNTVQDPGDRPATRIRGNIHPIGVADSVYWLCRKLDFLEG